MFVQSSKPDPHTHENSDHSGGGGENQDILLNKEHNTIITAPAACGAGELSLDTHTHPRPNTQAVVTSLDIWLNILLWPHLT